MYANTTITYTLPGVKDDQGDTWSASYAMGSASTFTTINNGKFTFSPTSSNVGTFPITITLTDNNLYNPK